MIIQTWSQRYMQLVCALMLICLFNICGHIDGWMCPPAFPYENFVMQYTEKCLGVKIGNSIEKK